MDGVITKITKAMQTAVKTIQTTLIKPEVKKANTEQIKKKARSSILDRLAKQKLLRNRRTGSDGNTKEELNWEGTIWSCDVKKEEKDEYI